MDLISRGEGAMKILVCIDGSEFSKNAVRFGACLSAKIKAEVVALRVIDVPRYSHWMAISKKVKEEMNESAKKIIDDAQEIARKEFGVEVIGLIKEGSPVEIIIKTVHEDDEIAMVVLGASGKSHTARRFVGSTTEELIREVSRSLHCAVIVVPGHDEMYSKRCAMAH